jgi:hypothetical protein
MSDYQYNTHQKSYVCIHIFNGTAPVLLVSRADGDWCFLCGANHKDDPSEYRVVGMGHELVKDPTLLPLLDLPPEWEAERRSVNDQWIRLPID